MSFPDGRRETALAALALLWLPGGQRAARDLYAEAEGISDPEAAVALALPALTADARRAAFDKARRAFAHGDALGVAAIGLDSPRYPELLRAIPDPPPLLFVRGTLPDDWALAAAVIGTRTPSEDALAATTRVVTALGADARAIVVSGLAEGIDTRAHVTALDRGLQTVAVMAGGLDGVYPSSNKALFARIAASCCAVSERPVGMRPDRLAFVLRDRLQSGLGHATFLIQSAIDGGSMHAARFTLAQGRALIALRPMDHDREWGGNALLTDPAPTSENVRLAKMARLSPPFAHAMSVGSIERFVEAGLRTGFRTRGEREREREMVGEGRDLS